MAGITSTKKNNYKDQRLTKAQQKKSKAVNSAGIKNYLGEQENVTVPKKWLSSPDHVVAELAYITPREQKILLDADLYGSLNGEPNRGPGGIMSLQGAGDGGGVTSDGKGGHKGTGRSDIDPGPAAKAAIAAGKPTSVDTKEDEKRAKKEAKDFRQSKYDKGYEPVNIFEKAQFYNTNYRTNFVNRQIEKKKAAIRDYINKNRVQNPHMDTDEIMEGIMGSYNAATGTFDTYDFTSGLNKGTTFDINKIGGPQLGPFGLSANKKYGDKGKLGTKYLDQTPDFTSHPSTVPSFAGAFLNKVSPMNMNTLKSTLNRMNLLENMKTDGVTQAKIDDYYDRTMGRGDYDIFDRDLGGDGLQPYLPIDYNTGAVTEVVEPYTNDFAYRFGDEQKVGRDVTLGYAANGGRIGKAFGGIMDTATGRKGFILGGIADAVGGVIGSVADAAGKVLKSDAGKMALLAAGAYYTGGALGGTGGFNNFATLGSKAMQGAKFLGKKALFTDGALDFGKAAILGASALPFFMKQPEDPDIGMAERGGRLKDSQGNEVLPSDLRKEVVDAYKSGDADKIAAIQDYYKFLPGLNAVRLPDISPYLPYPNYADGGRIGFAGGSGFGPEGWSGIERAKRVWNSMSDDIQLLYPGGFHDFFMGGEWVDINMAKGGRVPAQEGGLMNLGGMEKDYRNEGGFVPIGKEEKADDVPARLSVNEFVFTADAVRNAGGGDIDKGAEVMENMMKNLENGGRVSEESQGNTGAQEMFSVSERIGEVI